MLYKGKITISTNRCTIKCSITYIKIYATSVKNESTNTYTTMKKILTYTTIVYFYNSKVFQTH